MNIDEIKKRIDWRLGYTKAMNDSKLNQELLALLIAVEALEDEAHVLSKLGFKLRADVLHKALSTISDILEGKKE